MQDGAVGCLDKELYVLYLGTNELSRAGGRGRGRRAALWGAPSLRDHSATPATSFRTPEESSRARNAFVISLERARILLAREAPGYNVPLWVSELSSTPRHL